MAEIEELMGKDLVLERVRPGEGKIAEVGVIVQCNYRAYFYSIIEQKRLSDTPFEECRNQSFQIGEGDCIPGLELALRHSHIGEILKVYSASKFAYGYTGRCFNADGSTMNSKVVPIPPDTDIEYEIEIIRHICDQELEGDLTLRFEKDFYKTENEDERNIIYRRYQTLQAMQFRKEAGNRWFSYQDFPRAAKAYSRATQFAEGYFNPDKNKRSLGDTVEDASKTLQQQHEHEQKAIDKEDRDLVEVYIACLNNLAACKISLKEYAAAKDLCVQVLELSPLNGKALLRAAKATLALDGYDECEACLKKLLSIDNIEDSLKTAAKLEYQKLKKALSDYKNNTKEMQKRIATKLFNSTHDKDKTSSTAESKIADERTSTAEEVQLKAGIDQVAAEEKSIQPNHNSAPGAKEFPEDKKIKNSVVDSALPPNLSSTTKTDSSYANSNLIILLGTSLAVVVLSIFFAFSSRQTSVT